MYTAYLLQECCSVIIFSLCFIIERARMRCLGKDINYCRNTRVESNYHNTYQAPRTSSDFLSTNFMIIKQNTDTILDYIDTGDLR